MLTKAGEPDVLTEQRAHLGNPARADHVHLRVLTFDAGLHPSVRGAFSILGFPDPDDPPVAYVETFDAARYPEAPTQVARYRRRFERLWQLATPIEEYSP